MQRAEIRTDLPLEYFKELIDAALMHQQLVVAAETASYVVRLLADFVRMDSDLDVSAVRLVDPSVNAKEWRASLQQVADVSLFISGFFAESVLRRWYRAEDLVRIGGGAYLALSRRAGEELRPVFAELALRFPAFVFVLEEVSDRSASSTNRELVRLYDKWRRTGSSRTEALLIERGLVPSTNWRLQ